eukprot:gene20449-20017_t
MSDTPLIEAVDAEDQAKVERILAVSTADLDKKDEITAMGFPADQAKAALTSSGKNVAAAIDILVAAAKEAEIAAEISTPIPNVEETPTLPLADTLAAARASCSTF